MRTSPNGTVRNWSPVDYLAAAAVVLGGGLLRFLGLAQPAAFVFDEHFYAPDACWYALASPTVCEVAKESIRLHPPLAKSLIGAGIALVGYHPLGWRLAAAVAGTVTLGLLYILARRTLRSTSGAVLAAGLLAVDFLHFVNSRVAMLDVFLTMFGVAAVLFAVLDRDQVLRFRQPDEGIPLRTRLLRPWLVLAGAASGAAVASKWSGLSVLLGVFLLAVLGGVMMGNRRPGVRPQVVTLGRDAVALVAWLVVLPAVVYVASYAGYLSGTLVTWPWSKASWFWAVMRRQLAMVHWVSLDFGTHPEQSMPWTWPLSIRPLVCYLDPAGGDVRGILGFGNPVLWVASLGAVLFAAVRWIRSRFRGWVEAVIVVSVVVTYGPWFLISLHRSFVFLYYLLPTVPFLYLGFAYAATMILRKWRAPGVAVILTGAAALVVIYYPLLTALPLPGDAWQWRLPFARFLRIP